MISKNRTSIILCVLICILFSFCGKKKIGIQERKYSLDWADLPYHNQVETYIVKQLGTPNKISYIKIYNNDKRELHSLYRPLIRFLPANKDTIIIEEILWKQDSYLICYWFTEKDSLWISVDGIMYDPKHVEF